MTTQIYSLFLYEQGSRFSAAKNAIFHGRLLHFPWRFHVNQMLIILFPVMVNWHITHLAPRQAAFRTKCILSELRNALIRCYFNSSFITMYCNCIHCSTLHARTTHSLLQWQASRQITATADTHLKLNPSCRKLLQAI